VWYGKAELVTHRISTSERVSWKECETFFPMVLACNFDLEDFEIIYEATAARASNLIEWVLLRLTWVKIPLEASIGK
jgi:hypothetical protein